jgi:purine-binding chemotaxis protein CheW
MNLDLRKLGAPARDERKLVGFTIDGVAYGIDIMSVSEVINPTALVAVPALSPHVKGVTDHREAVVPIVDLRARFGSGESPGMSKTKWIIVKIDGKDVGLEVDRVTQVLTVTSDIKRGAMPEAYVEKPWVKEVFQTQDELVFELNLTAVVQPLQIEEAAEDEERQMS